MPQCLTKQLILLRWPSLIQPWLCVQLNWCFSSHLWVTVSHCHCQEHYQKFMKKIKKIYSVESALLNSQYFGLPQSRERLYIRLVHLLLMCLGFFSTEQCQNCLKWFECNCCVGDARWPPWAKPSGKTSSGVCESSRRWLLIQLRIMQS